MSLGYVMEEENFHPPHTSKSRGRKYKGEIET
jgi:hypothetical protein